jgi:hypothetical protein
METSGFLHWLILLSCGKKSLLRYPSMEPTPPQDLTIGQAHGGLLKNLIVEHKLVENQVLTPEEAEKLLMHPFDAPKTWEIRDLLHRTMTEVERQRRQSPAPLPQSMPEAAPVSPNPEIYAELRKAGRLESSDHNHPLAADQVLHSSNRLRDIADDLANEAYAAGDRSFYAYLQRMKEILLLNEGFEDFDTYKPYMRGSWTGVADRYGLPEPTRAAAEADYLRLASQKSPEPGGIFPACPQGPTAATTAQEESPSVIDLSELILEEQMKINADYLTENRIHLESAILNPLYRGWVNSGMTVAWQTWKSANLALPVDNCPP